MNIELQGYRKIWVQRVMKHNAFVVTLFTEDRYRIVSLKKLPDLSDKTVRRYLYDKIDMWRL